jgi:hypothetical protein
LGLGLIQIAIGIGIDWVPASISIRLLPVALGDVHLCPRAINIPSSFDPDPDSDFDFDAPTNAYPATIPVAVNGSG